MTEAQHGEGSRPRRFHGLDGRYWRLWGAAVISNLGDGLTAIAMPWLASTLTREPLLIAGIGLAVSLPWLLFSLQAGVITDRVDRRRLMGAMNSMRAVVALGVAVAILADAMSLPVLYAAALALGIAEVLFDNANQTILPSIVRRDRLERANGTIWGAQMVMNDFVAKPIAGVLIAVTIALPFAIDALTAVISAALILSINGSFRAEREPDQPRRTMRADIAEGLRWLWGHRLLRTLAVVLGALNGITAGTMAIFVLFAQEELGLSALGFGVLMTTSAVGGIVGSQTAEHVTRRIGPGGALKLTLVVPVAGFAAIAVTTNPIVAGAAFVAYGFLAVQWNVVTVSLRQTIIPDRLLGRVNSVYRFFGWGAMPLGTMLGGALASAVETLMGRSAGLRAPFVAAALLHLLLVAVALPRLTTRSIEEAKADADGTDGESAGHAERPETGGPSEPGASD